jgi:hypothetical protein
MDSDCSVSFCPYAGHDFVPLHEAKTTTNKIKSTAIMKTFFMIYFVKLSDKALNSKISKKNILIEIPF